MRTVILLFLLFMGLNCLSQTFIKVDGTEFIKDGKSYFFVGSNYWYGMNLASKGEGGDRDRLIEELDHFTSLGILNLRIMAACEGPEDEPYRIKPSLMISPGKYNNDLLEGLDFLLDEMAKRDMNAVVCLNNFWPWSGGMAQYLAWSREEDIPYPSDQEGSWGKYMNYTAEFYKNKKANKLFREYIKTIINRTNSINGKSYKNDPTIMSWQLANEPRGMKKEKRLNKWIRKTAKYVKSLDPNHLVSTGSEGEVIRKTSGNDFKGNHKSKYIDYTTIHLWIQNWNWYDPFKPDSSFSIAINHARKYIRKHIDLSAELGKPLVLEEFGISRDYNDHNPNAGVYWRDLYFSSLYSILLEHAKKGRVLAGSNLWSWSGAGRPDKPHEMWKRGDAFTGDPPHELQGWYSVYDNDLSTLDIISKFALKFKKLSQRDE